MNYLSQHYHYNLHGVLGLSSGLFDLSVGTIVLLQSRSSRVNRSFFLITVTAFVWVFGFGMMSLADRVADAYHWASFAYLGIPFISPSVFLFSQCLSGEKLNRWSIGAFVSGAAFALPLVLVPTRLFTFTDHLWGRYLRVNKIFSARIFYVGLIAVFTLVALMAMKNFLKGWRSAPDPDRRIQCRNIFIAFIVAYVGSVDFAVKLGLRVYPSGCLWLSGLILVVAYTILRHKALDINLRANRVWLLVMIYSALVFLACPLVTISLQHSVHRLDAGDVLAMIVVALVSAIFVAAGPVIYAYLAGENFLFKGHAAGGITHELKSPIAAIQSAVEFLKRPPDEAGNKTSDYVTMIERNATRLELYVKNLLDLLRIQADALSLKPEALDLAAVIQDVVSIHRTGADKKGIEISVIERGDATVTADRNAIHQVISNLIGNSIKFSNKGNITISIGRNEDFVHVSVRDEGEGLDAQDLEKIFDPFVQVRQGDTGSGLGLAIAKGWVEAHKGRIWASSSGRGTGTTVTFTVPAYRRR